MAPALPRRTRLDGLTLAELGALSADVARSIEPSAPWASLEELFTAPEYFGVPASPLQRALCRVADGKPLDDLASHPDVLAGLSGTCLLTGAPLELAVLSGIRAGKSLFAAALCVHWSQRVDLTLASSAGDLPRIASVSITKDLAEAVFDHLSGNVMARPGLRPLVVEAPVSGRVVLRHPTGRPIEIVVAAGARGGASLVARWLAGVVFDEFALMSGEGEAVINWTEQRKAVRNRILPGGGIMHIGSPWAPFGPAYQLVREHWGKPTRGLVVVKAPGPAMNPAWWTPERVEEARVGDPDAFQMTVMAEFGTPPEAMFSDTSLRRCTRVVAELPRDPQAEYTAAMDPATRGNGWTLVIATRDGRRRVVVLAREWRGSKVEPLDPDKVFEEMAPVLQQYGVRFVYTDQWAADPLKALARRHGISVVERGAQSEELFDRYLAFRTRLETGDIELPPEPQLQADLRRVQKRTTTRGFAVHLPNTNDGRHCDYAPAVMLALARYLGDVSEVQPEAGTPEAVRLEAKLLKAEFLNRDVQKVPYWKRRVGR